MERLNRTVALVGMMGAGKSSVGRRLAARLGVSFHDADAEIEMAAGCSINELFERFGEPAFRDGERRVITRLLSEPAHVLATGGGAFIEPQTHAALKARTLTIWIKAPLELLLERVSRRETRPLLRNVDQRAMLEKLLAERTPIYEQADITIDSKPGPHGLAVDEIVTELKRRELVSA